MKSYLVIFILVGLISCAENQDKISSNEVTEEHDKIEAVIDTLQKVYIDSSLIVVDTSTNLVWMKNDFSFVKGRFLNNWNEVFEWEKEMNLVKYAGIDGWKVPSIKEYRSMNQNRSDRKKHNVLFNYIDSTSSWGKGPYSYWSSTTPNKYTASYISFIDGFATSGNRAKKFSGLTGVELGMSVRLVRNQ
ncbi:MAG: hypothetical protein ACJAZ2_002351 [Glaciecola sp.]|jgi:hypothetical protein